MACDPYSTTVKPGDGWYRIAARFGVKAVDLAVANHATLRTMLHPGDELVVPGRCAEVPPPTPGAVDAKPPFMWVTSTDDDTEEAWRLPGRPIIFLVIHDPVAASPDGLLRYLRWNDRQVSYNDVLVPGSPPKCHVLSDQDEWVGHAGGGTATDARNGTVYGKAVGGNLNHVSWGVCLYKHEADNGPFSEPMYTAAVALVAQRARQFGVDVQNILAHREVDPRRRSDPRGLDLGRFRGHVANAMQA